MRTIVVHCNACDIDKDPCVIRIPTARTSTTKLIERIQTHGIFCPLPNSQAEPAPKGRFTISIEDIDRLTPPLDA